MSLTHLTDIHQTLKQSTRSAHKKLDSLFVFEHLLSTDLNIKHYKLVLQCMYPWYQHFETCVDEKLMLNKHLPHFKMKHNLILADLETIDSSECYVNHDFKNLTTNILSTPFLLGILYVIEGSTLGGLVIAPKIEKSLKQTNISRFYRSYGSAKVSNFQTTLAFIAGKVSTKQAEDELLSGANFAFSSLYDFMQSANKSCVDTKNFAGEAAFVK